MDLARPSINDLESWSPDFDNENYEKCLTVLSLVYQTCMTTIADVSDLFTSGLFVKNLEDQKVYSDYLFQGTNLTALGISLLEDGTYKFVRNVGTTYFAETDDPLKAFGYALGGGSYWRPKSELLRKTLDSGELRVIVAVKKTEFMRFNDYGKSENQLLLFEDFLYLKGVKIFLFKPNRQFRNESRSLGFVDE